MDTLLSRRIFVGMPVLASIQPVIDDGQAPDPAVGSASVPTYRGNLARTGENPGPAPSGKPQALWDLRIGSAISSSPAVVDSVVYVGTLTPGIAEGGALFALNAESGIERWRVPTSLGDGFFSSPAVGDGIVVAATYDGVVIAADIETGEVLWRFQTEAFIQLHSPAIAGHMVLVTDQGGHLYALGTKDGELRWRFASGDGVSRSFSSPSIKGDTVFLVDSSRRRSQPSLVHALNAANGETKWTLESGEGESFAGTPILIGELVYVIVGRTSLVAIDAKNGREHHRMETGTGILTQPALSSDVAYCTTRSGDLRAIDLRSGSEKWSRQLTGDSTPLFSPTVAGGSVFVGDVEGRLYVLDAATGEDVWSAKVGILRSSPAIVAGAVYFGSKQGALRAIGGKG